MRSIPDRVIGLAVRNDGEGLEGRLAETRQGLRADVSRDEVARVRGRGQLDALAAADQPDPATGEAHLEVPDARVDDIGVDAGERPDLLAREGPLGDEEQGFERGLGELARPLRCRV